MPQIQRGDAKQVQSTASVKENKLFRERLMDRFGPSDFVRVQNIDDQPFEWKYMPTGAEDESMSDDGLMRSINGRESFSPDFSRRIPGNEQFWRIDPNEQEVLVGENAYLFIEGLFKRLAAKAVLKGKNSDETRAINFNWSDGTRQEEYIDKIVLGKEVPQFNGGQANIGSASTTTVKK